jgi:two-component system, NarL family, sensor histidine kinase DesK
MAQRRDGRSGLVAAFGSRADEDCLDPQVAPGAYKGSSPAAPFTPRRGVQNMVWIYAAGLAFLAFGIPQVAESAGDPVALAVQIALLVLIGLAYLGAAWAADLTLAGRWLYIAVFVVLLIALSPWWGWDFVNQGVYVSILLATLIPWRQSRIAVIAVNLLIGVVALVSANLTPLLIALIGAILGLAMAAGMESGRIGARLHRAEQQVSSLALAAERERISRDLHDILGHSLTAISIKADLAEKLVDRDPGAARSEIAEVSVIARQALADVRATASAIRQVRVAAELASARSVLLAAGIEPITPTALEPMPDATSELFGYVIREAVTNVVRHSEAAHCVIIVGAQQVSVTDDGAGIRSPGSGSGLVGLRERVAAAGGRLSVGPGPEGGTRVTAALPADPDRTGRPQHAPAEVAGP